MQNKTLLLVTNHFPYGKGESFVGLEVPYLVKSFKKLVILARDKTNVLTGDTSGYTYYRANPKSSLGEKIQTFLLILFRLKTFRALYREEKKYLAQKNIAFTPAIRKQMRHDLVKAFALSLVMEKIIKKEKIQGELILYSYWLTNVALAITLVRAKHVRIKTIARGHGGDIHEFRHRNRYLTFRNILAKRLDKIVISAPAGREHFIGFIDDDLKSKVLVSHLGTKLFGNSPQHRTEKNFVVLTCSHIVEVKRLHLVVEALALIDDLPIHWVHIGEGNLRPQIEELCHTKLDPKSNITYTFTGQKKYEEVIGFYRNHYIDLFLNTSSSEATPVSIMEAHSFGVPAIGFDVGGVGDIVNASTGRLLKATDTAVELSRAIKEILGQPTAEMEKMRQVTKEIWQQRYHEDVAYPRFVGILQSL